MNQRQYYTYILTNIYNTVLYTGITNNLFRRLEEHKSGQGGFFTSKYKCHKLVYFEIAEEPLVAIAREKQIKGLSREKKRTLINTMNPEWKNLMDELEGE